jgi:hypothetical protein
MVILDNGKEKLNLIIVYLKKKKMKMKKKMKIINEFNTLFYGEVG